MFIVARYGHRVRNGCGHRGGRHSTDQGWLDESEPFGLGEEEGGACYLIAPSYTDLMVLRACAAPFPVISFRCFSLSCLLILLFLCRTPWWTFTLLSICQRPPCTGYTPTLCGRVPTTSSVCPLLQACLFLSVRRIHELRRNGKRRKRCFFVKSSSLGAVFLAWCADGSVGFPGVSITPMWASAAMAFSSVSVVCSSLWLKRYRRPVLTSSGTLEIPHVPIGTQFRRWVCFIVSCCCLCGLFASHVAWCMVHFPVWTGAADGND